MKFNMFYSLKVVLLGLLLSISLINCISTNMKEKSKGQSKAQSLSKQYQTDVELKDLVKTLFSEPTCPTNLKNKGNQDKPKVTMVGTSGLWAIPRNKVNKYDSRLYGWGPSAYLFDYLDPVLEEKIIKIFNDLWTEVYGITSFPTKEDKEDPYTLQRIFNMPGQTEAVLLEKFKALKPSFNKDVWMASVTIPQIRMNSKHWNFNANTNDPAREIVDTYDYNGDGRLSRKEYLIAYLNINRAVMGQKRCTTYKDSKGVEKENECIHSFIRNIIYPLFFRADCGDYDDKIGSEEIWYSFNSLIRKHNDKPEKRFNIYSCIILNEPYHTTAINDFILKSQKTIESYLNKLEFTRGIFLAYWARSVTDETIYPSYYQVELKPQANRVVHNMKEKRWTASDNLDNKCILLQS
jgi:hypothetical protein